MGKITSIYLTDEEVAGLKRFCSENKCTQYSALKAALRELVSKPVEKEDSELVKKEEQTQKKKPSLFSLLGETK